mmetsp:Transcript_24920/g.25139  ORF Transcript_24920/g.25139 Transcript_24920/m.25139 type:complete len:220 (+) Transcript_24920:105-764(+)
MSMDEPKEIRSGHWTIHEENYARALIEGYKYGYISPNLVGGTSLRSFLARQLNCDAMRVSKKFIGLSGLGSKCNTVVTVDEDRANEWGTKLIGLKNKFLEGEVLQAARRRKRKRDKDDIFRSIPQTAYSMMNSINNYSCKAITSYQTEIADIAEDFDFDEFLKDEPDFRSRKREISTVQNDNDLVYSGSNVDSLHPLDDILLSSFSNDIPFPFPSLSAS